MAITLDDQITDFLKTLTDDDRVLFLLTYSLGRVLNRMKNKKMKWREEAINVDLRHIVHWLEIAIFHNDEWLNNKDKDDVPKKLFKFSNLEGIMNEANKAIIKRSNETPVIKISDGDELLEKELSDGWYIVRLLTPAALDYESSIMQHCVGHGIYDSKVMSGKVIILSLRDRYNKPHVTIEVNPQDECINQIRGKQNQRPIPKYARNVRMFIKQSNYRRIDRPIEIGLIADEWGEMHDIDELPRYLSIRGNLNLSDCHLEELPDFLEVSNDLIIENSSIGKLPAGLKVLGSLKANGSQLSSLNSEHGIGKSISVKGCPIHTLPQELFVDGNLDISQTRISSFGKSTIITGDLVAENSCIETLPRDLVVGKNIVLNNTPVKSFDKGRVYIGGSLFIKGCDNFTLPEILFIEKSLFTENTRLSGDPRKIEIGNNLFCHQSNMGDFKSSILTYGSIVGRRPSNNKELHRALNPSEQPQGLFS